jgi:hypothetical protein
MKSVIIDGIEYVPKEVEDIKYDRNFGDNKRCECGHPYYRHFDTYEDMAPIGCKYCQCSRFKEAAPSIKQEPKEDVWGTKCLSLNDILDCWYTDEDIKKQHLAHSAHFYRNDLKYSHPLFQRIKSAAFKQSSEPLPKEEGKMPLKLYKDASDFIQMTFNVSDDFYWTNFFFKKVGDNTYELWKHNELPKHVKGFTNEYTQQQMDEAMRDAFNAGRTITAVPSVVHPGNITTEPVYTTFEDYINSLHKTKQ